jgi:hypothetical protein
MAVMVSLDGAEALVWLGCLIRWSLEYFARYVRDNREALATIVWKDTPPQHFEYENGHYWCAHACLGSSAPLSPPVSS